jgi:acetyl esterase/lipase
MKDILKDYPMELLWPDGAPGAVGDADEDTPTLFVALAPADKATGVAVVVCPGGGYGGLAADHEGRQVAEWLNGEGISAFVLRYRHAPKYRHPIPLGDAQRAIRTVRARAAEWGVDPSKIGILGFSAGGHLTSTAGTMFAPGKPEADDPIERVTSRPDFLVLCYPVITMSKPEAHMGSARNLLGETPDPGMLEKLSTETRVTENTPPTFLMHTTGDKGVPSLNSVFFYEALVRHKVPAEMHIFAQGPHGVGLAPNDPALAVWPSLCITWLRKEGFLPVE